MIASSLSMVSARRFAKRAPISHRSAPMNSAASPSTRCSRRTGLDPALVDEVIFGCVAQPVDAANVARVIALRAGIPESVPASTVQRNCASGCEAVTLAQEKLLAGRGSIFIVGGAESMSNIPLLFKSSTAAKFGRLSRAKSLGQTLADALAAFVLPIFNRASGCCWV